MCQDSKRADGFSYNHYFGGRDMSGNGNGFGLRYKGRIILVELGDVCASLDIVLFDFGVQGGTGYTKQCGCPCFLPAAFLKRPCNKLSFRLIERKITGF